MKTIITMLENERKELEKVIASTEKRLKDSPKGYLRIAKKKNKIEYYYKTNEKGISSGNGKYMKKSEYPLAKKIAQRDYDMWIQKNARERLKAIDIFLRKYKKTNLKEVWEKMNPCRKSLLDAAIISDEEYVKQWQMITYTGKEFFDEQVIITERGERVRSKSEKIIADKLYFMGIPYRYEFPLRLKDHVKIYPDFTILRMPEREEVYLEHFGMMDDSDYVNSAIYKLHTYERNEIYLGVKLFLTYETRKHPLNTKTLDGMIKELFDAK